MKRFSQSTEYVSIQQKLLFFLPLFIVLLLVGVNVFYSSSMVSRGEKLRELETYQHSLLLEQKLLEAELAQKQSLHVLETEAKIQGYVPITKVTFVQTTKSVALSTN